jgi:hypothetical protein
MRLRSLRFDEYKLEPLLLRRDRGGEEWRLLGGTTAEYFGATRLDVSGEMSIGAGGFYIGIVTSGVLSGSFGDIALAAGDSFVCSATVPEHAFRPKGGQHLEIVRCLPPE